MPRKKEMMKMKCEIDEIDEEEYCAQEEEEIDFEDE
jgi:hypothetical protein